jgi:WD40 repeat protein
MIFISHSSKDKDAALDVQQRLLAYGYEASQLFLDSDAETGIPAGSKWEQVLYARLKDCRALIVLCSANWQESRWCFAELVFAKAMGKEIFPVLLQECSIDQVAAEHQAVFVYKDREEAYKRLRDVLDSRHLGPRDDFGWPPKDGDHCPFPGLPAFDERLAGVYFGREAETQTILEDLRKMRANGEPRLLMIVGGSGSGKSSLLKAGVLPRLIHKTADTEWVVLPTLRYGEQANEQRTVLDQLAVNLVGLFPKDVASTPDWKLLRAKLISDDVKQAVKVFLEISQDLTLARNCSNATVLIAIDQFEELFAPSAGPMAGQFLRFLRELLNCRNGQLLAIGTMRSDHLDIYEQSYDALRSPYFQPWRLGPFPPERIEEVIRKPANRAHVDITDELVERLKRDTPTAEALPLLAFTLEKLYRGYASDGELELKDYVSLGGMEGAIQTCIDRIVPRNSLSASEAVALRLTFVKHLAQVNDKGEVVRLTARWDDLPAAAKPILKKLINERLLSTGSKDVGLENEGGGKSEQPSGSIEVAHEAMFRCWHDLKEWLRTSADILRWRRDVRRDRVNEPRWTDLRPAQLAVARDWPIKRRDELTSDEVGWIKRGIRWERIRRGIVATVVLVVALLAGIAWWQRNEAENRSQDAEVAKTEAKRQEAIARENADKEVIARNSAEEQARIAESRRLAAASSSVLTKYPQRSLLLAVEAAKLGQSIHGLRIAAAGEQSLREALAFVGGRSIAHASASIEAVAISPDNHWVVTASKDNTLSLWDLRTKNPFAKPVVLSGHESLVKAMTISPDNHWLVTGSYDKMARLWDLSAKDPAASPVVLRGHEGAVNAVAISPDNRWVVTGSDDETARLWDLSAKDPAASPVVLRGHGAVNAVAISPDNHWVVTGGRDWITRLWNLRAQDPSATSLELNHGQSVIAVAISADNHWLVTGGEDPSARLYDLTAKDPTANSIVLAGHEKKVSAVAISSDSHWLLTGSADDTARLWDLTARDPAVAPVVLRGHESAINAVAISSKNHWLVTGSEDNTVRLWDLSAKDPSANPVVLRGHESAVRALAVSSDNHWLVTGSGDNTARLWDLRNKDASNSPVVLRGHESAVTAVAISSDNHWLVTGSEDTTARLWDLRAKDPSANPNVLRGHQSTILALAISSDNHWLVTGNVGNTASLWDLSSIDQSANPVLLGGYQRAAVDAVAISRDNHWLVTGSQDNIVALWDLRSEDPSVNPIVMLGDNKKVSVVVISPDNHWLVAGSEDTTARLWDLKAKDPLTNPVVLSGHENMVSAVAISPDNHWLVTGSYDKTARLWDLSAKDPSANPVVLRGHESAINAVAISPDNHWLATGSEDKTVRLWDLSTKDPEASPVILRGHEKAVWTVAISANNRWLATGSEDKTARLWPLQLNELIDLAHVTVGRNFTKEEWSLYFFGESYRKTFPDLPDPSASKGASQ